MYECDKEAQHKVLFFSSPVLFSDGRLFWIFFWAIIGIQENAEGHVQSLAKVEEEVRKIKRKKERKKETKIEERKKDRKERLIFDTSKKNPRPDGYRCTAGTTATVCFMRNNRLVIGHVGDSKAVISRDGEVCSKLCICWLLLLLL